MNSRLPYLFLQLCAQTLDGVEHERKAAENRLRSFVEEPKNEYDTAKGFGDTEQAEMLRAVVDQLRAIEAQTIDDLETAAGAIVWVPEFVESRAGIGYKGIGRILGAVGDPAWNSLAERVRRGPEELYAYCGLHTIPAGDHNLTDTHPAAVSGGNVRPRRQRGVKCNWSPRAKTATYVVAESAYRQGFYRPLYVAKREAAADKVHVAECRNRVRPPGRSNGCGTTAHPEWGEPGSPWRAGHQHQHAISMVGKKILKEMFIEARAVA